MTERPLIAGARIDEPFIFPCAFNVSLDACSNGAGVHFELFDALMATLGLKYKLARDEDHVSGYKNGNDTPRGLIGKLLRGEIDMTASLLPMDLDESAKDIEFSAPATYYIPAFLFHQPDPTDATVSPWFLAKVFNPSVWVCFLSILVTYVFLIFGARMLAVSKYRRHTWHYFSDSLVDVVRSPLGQTEPWHYITPLRLTLNYLNVPIFLLMNIYTAYMTGSMLVLGRTGDPFHGLNDLARLVYDKRFTLVNLNANSRRSVTPNVSSTDPEDIIGVARAWNPPVMASSVSEAVEMVANNRSLVLRGPYKQLIHASALSCRTRVIEDRDTDPTPLAYAFRKNDTLEKLVSKILSDSARIDRFLRGSYRKYSSKRKCDDDAKRKPTFFALGLLQLQHGHFLLLYGLLASLPIFLLELSADRICKTLDRLFPKRRKHHTAASTTLPFRHRRTMHNTRVDVSQLWNSTNQLSPNMLQSFGVRRTSRVSNLGIRGGQ